MPEPAKREHHLVLPVYNPGERFSVDQLDRNTDQTRSLVFVRLIGKNNVVVLTQHLVKTAKLRDDDATFLLLCYTKGHGPFFLLIPTVGRRVSAIFVPNSTMSRVSL